MTKRAGRPDQTTPPGRRAGRTSPVWLLVLGVWLGSLLNLALNTATDTTKPYPGPLHWLQQYPWHAVALFTLLAAVLAWWQYQRAATTQPARGGSLPGMLILRQETVVTAAELAGLRPQLLEQVRRTWIQGVLDRSLAQVARVELGLADQPSAVDHPWRTLVVQPGQPEQALPPGTRIAAVASRFDQQLLILGGPGAGKTTLLLEYTRDLLDQADRNAAAPIPLIFHLSAWPAEQPPMEGWLAEELALRYGVSRRLAVDLIDRDRLAVLLDGLDEVPQARRAACAQAINAFRGEHGGVPLVVCARSRDYQELATRLVLKGAVVVQPLDREQVAGWLAAAGRPLAGLRTALDDADHWLWELLDSPLLLSITELTYRDKPASAVRAHGSTEGLLGAYVEVMLGRPREPLAAPQDQATYTDADTLRWLGWLAERMGAESVFYPDWMQPDWLPTRRQRWQATTGLSLAVFLAVGLAGGLAGGLAVGLGVGLAVSLAVGLSVGLSVGLGGGLVVGLFVGVFAGIGMGVTRRGSRIKPIEPTRWSWSTARQNLVVGLVVGLVLGLVFGLIIGLVGGRFSGQVGGLLIGLTAWAIIVLTGGFASRPNVRPAAPLEGIRAAGRVGRSTGVIGGLVAGLVFGLGTGLVYGLGTGLGTGLAMGLVGGLAMGLAMGLNVGLSGGGASYLRHRLLVTLLQRQGLIPADLVGFLDYADSRILLRRAGGGYLFIHRLLQDYLRNRAHQADPLHGTPAATSQAASVQ